MFRKKEKPLTREDVYLVFIDCNDEILAGRGEGLNTSCRILAHNRIPAFYAYADGRNIADLDPHEILHAMAENRLIFMSEHDKELFVSILVEKLKDGEDLTRIISKVGMVAVGVTAVAVLTVVAVIAGRKALDSSVLR